MPITIEGVAANPGPGQITSILGVFQRLPWCQGMAQISVLEAGQPVSHESSKPVRCHSMDNVIRLFQAFVAPAIFVSAISLLVLSVNVRLMGIVSRLRQYNRAKYKALRENYMDEADAYASQIMSIEVRAEKMRRCFLFSLISLIGAIASCLLLGFGLYWNDAAFAAAAIFVASLILLLIGVGYYVGEVMTSLTAVRNEVRDPRFGAPPETANQESI